MTKTQDQQSPVFCNAFRLKADIRRLPVARERRDNGSTTKKCDEFPSPHGFARAKDFVGYEKNAKRPPGKSR